MTAFELLYHRTLPLHLAGAQVPHFLRMRKTGEFHLRRDVHPAVPCPLFFPSHLLPWSHPSQTVIRHPRRRHPRLCTKRWHVVFRQAAAARRQQIMGRARLAADLEHLGQRSVRSGRLTGFHQLSCFAQLPLRILMTHTSIWLLLACGCAR
jgi:hypothetical protein